MYILAFGELPAPDDYVYNPKQLHEVTPPRIGIPENLDRISMSTDE
jgi:hypothetical protein